jgi:hypothetical protein
MKTSHFSVVIHLWFIMSFLSCSKKDATSLTPFSSSATSLTIKITDDAGLPVSEASVRLYSSKEDLDKDTNQVSNTIIADKNGIAMFPVLLPQKYYWRIQKECLDNYYSVISSGEPLIENAANTANVILYGSGNIKLINTSRDPYKIYINGALTVDNLRGFSRQTLTNKLIGFYSVRVVQLSGYNSSPSDKTFTGTLKCGYTLTTTFP